MSGLLDALHRLEGFASPPVAVETNSPPDELAEPPVIDDLAAALVAACPPSALLALVGVGVEEPWAPLLRETAETVARRIGRDVVLLGPGLLDDGPRLTAQWSALRERAAYGFLHASAEYAAGRLDGLRRVDAVVPVVELGRTSSRAVATLRRLCRDGGIEVLGAIVVGD